MSIVGALGALVFFGTHIDQKYQALQIETETHSEADGEERVENLNLADDDISVNVGEMKDS